MSLKLKLKIALVIFLTIFAGILLLPTFFPELPPWFTKYVYKGNLKLGLDLKGGIHLVLKPDFEKALENQFQFYLQELENKAKKKGLVFELKSSGLKAEFFFYKEEDANRFIEEILKDFEQVQYRGPTKEENIIKIEVALSPERIKFIEKNLLTQVVEVIRNRIDQFGVAEAIITTHGKDKIVVELPGVKDPERAINIIGQIAQLEFKLVDEETMRKIDLSALIDQLLKEGVVKPGASLEEWRKAIAPYIPQDSEFYFYVEKDRETKKIIKRGIILKKQTLLTGKYIEDAGVQIDPQFNEPYVWLKFNSKGAKIFEQITKENVGKRLAIVLDDVVRSAPVIKEKISGGEAQITGAFTIEEAHDLAVVLRAGALPAPVKILQNITIGPSLGKDSIKRGIIAGLIGAFTIIVFTIIYYRISGVIAIIALILNIYYLLALLSAFQATLTLPGIAGIILSIGMGIDSNVLIFERIREELKIGRSSYSAIFQGYSKAFWTIFDAHITVLITSLILFIFGTGPIRGFAVTLSISIIVNLFTAIFVTRIFYETLYEKGKNINIKFLEFLSQPNFDFMKYKKICAGISLVMVLVGLFSFVQIMRGHANLGIDFTGGMLFYLKVEKTPPLEKIRKALIDAGIKDFSLQDVPDQNLLLLKVQISKEVLEQEEEKILNVLKTKLPDFHFEVVGKEEIGATISKELKRKAILAILGALIGIILYLTFRFNFYFGVSAGLTTFHDVLVVLGIFFLLGKEINLLFITALLTIAGYSLTDTVVIFDRIRENILKNNFKDFNALINKSINAVLSRTIITTLTTLFGSLALLIFGGVVIKDFALALTLGFIIGTYSSIFVASTLLEVFHKGKIPVIARKEELATKESSQV